MKNLPEFESLIRERSTDRPKPLMGMFDYYNDEDYTKPIINIGPYSIIQWGHYHGVGFFVIDAHWFQHIRDSFTLEKIDDGFLMGSYGDIKYMLIDRRKLVSDTELLIVYKKDGEITMDIETLKRVNE